MTTDWLLSDALGLSGPRGGPLSTYRVFVRDLVLECSIGIYDFERAKKQRVRINAELIVADEPDVSADEIAGVLNYEPVIEGIKRIAGAGHINLVETLAERIIDHCLAEPRVTAAHVVVEKLDIYPDASVGVTIERRRLRAGEGNFRG